MFQYVLSVLKNLYAEYELQIVSNVFSCVPISLLMLKIYSATDF